MMFKSGIIGIFSFMISDAFHLDLTLIENSKNIGFPDFLISDAEKTKIKHHRASELSLLKIPMTKKLKSKEKRHRDPRFRKSRCFCCFVYTKTHFTA